ncbi:tRNA lysidine(34) synthetase TilS [Lachnoclostridium sp. Marseille-P6806]|uniref:tRNA lysidine(34) synthetase TilS n=1 Tax=Lachnoclostridium sp. Marseille-P6806 TaxID=2364793 RepID=UPI0010307C68|nr:tRNA lysidine(34) synthetase TilS [Lachnoclostridium sp. Marseille-P6806]
MRARRFSGTRTASELSSFFAVMRRRRVFFTARASLKKRFGMEDIVRASDLARRTGRTMVEFHMTQPGDRVIIGLSGGADSLCLALVLKELSEDMGFLLRAVHVQHGLRETAERDADFVRAFCREEGIALRVEYMQADVYAREHRLSLEEAGRELRQQAFRRAAEDWDAECAAVRRPCRIALAHHREDCAETVLFHLSRGCSLPGLSGIRPLSENRIRPLIRASREEIEAYLAEKGRDWCLDETNDSDAYTRNRIRHHILPALEESVHGGAAEHIAELALAAAELEDYLERETGRAEALCRTEGGLCIGRLEEYPLLLQRRILYRALCGAAGRKKNIGRRHVEQLLSLCRSQEGSAQMRFPGGLRAERRYGSLLLFREDAPQQNLPGLYIDGNGISRPFPRAPEAYAVRECPPEQRRSTADERADRYTKYFDYDRIATDLCFRTRCPGDVITIGAGGEKKTLRRFMIDEKIPAAARDRLVLPAAGNEILWVPGFRVSGRFGVADRTERLLEITLKNTETGNGRK